MKPLFLTLIMSLSAAAETNMELLDRLVRDEKFGTIVAVHKAPLFKTAISAEYQFTEYKLRPKEVMYFYVPEDLSLLPLSQIGFAHRQSGMAPVRDYNPGLTSALVYTHDMPGDELRYWAGHSSGKLGAKFAEYRGSPEFDALYEWPKVGHKGVDSKTKSKDIIRANALRIQNVGTGNVLLSKVAMETIPKKADEEEILIFTPKSDFGDSETLEGRNYGGGQKLRGTFPHSLRLSTKGHSSYPTLPSHYKVDKNQLFINLPVGKKFNAVEIMCGDTHPDGVKNEDNGWGSLGSAQLSVSIENSITNEKRILLNEKNVGPEGVISASEIDPSTVIKDGDQLVITNKYKKSTAYIMALKVGINNAN
jgi:hypothetical protein